MTFRANSSPCLGYKEGKIQFAYLCLGSWLRPLKQNNRLSNDMHRNLIHVHRRICEKMVTQRNRAPCAFFARLDKKGLVVTEYDLPEGIWSQVGKLGGLSKAVLLLSFSVSLRPWRKGCSFPPVQEGHLGNEALWPASQEKGDRGDERTSCLCSFPCVKRAYWGAHQGWCMSTLCFLVIFWYP